jgi:glycosyltransferase involved in cell wall biosynthesis
MTRPLALTMLLNSLCTGGAERQVLLWLQHLDHEAFNPSVVTIKNDHGLDHSLRAPFEEAVGRPAISLGVQGGLSLAAVGRLAATLDQLGTDILVCTNPYALLYGTLARAWSRRRRQIRLVEVFHTTVPGTAKEARQMPLYRALMNRADLMVYVCETQARHWRQRGVLPRREVVIHNGIDLKRFAHEALAMGSATEADPVASATRPTQARLRIGLCAVMRPEKAHLDLLKALALLRQRGLDAEAWLIGDGPERPSIEAAIETLGLRGSAFITGLQSDVRPWIQRCDVMVLTSHAVETFSLAALEAMALGKPVVLSDLGGARELVTSGVNGDVYPVGDVHALADALALRADPSRRQREGQAGLARVRQFWDAPRMAQRYQEALMGLTVRSAS